MDMQLLLIIICVAAALFFIGRRFYRCLRKGQCSCGCENDGKASRFYRREAFGIRAFCY